MNKSLISAMILLAISACSSDHQTNTTVEKTTTVAPTDTSPVSSYDTQTTQTTTVKKSSW